VKDQFHIKEDETMWLLIDRSSGDRRRMSYSEQYVLFAFADEALREAESRGFGEGSPFGTPSIPTVDGEMSRFAVGDIDIGVLKIAESRCIARR